MANERTRLLEKYIVNIQKDKYEQFIDENNNCSNNIQKKNINLDDDVIMDNGSGLTHEQLMPFINDPWWIKVRYIVFFMYWAIFVVIFILACIISIMNLNECSLNMLSTVNTDPMMSSTTTQSYGSTVSSIVNSSTAQTTIDTILSPLIDIMTNSSGSLSKLN